MSYFKRNPPHFANQNTRTVEELGEEISWVEKIPIWITSDEETRRFKPYPSTHPSPGRMKGSDLKRDIERIYPDLEVEILSGFLTLEQLRMRHSP